MTRIVIVDGHPDPRPERFVHALAEAYAAGAVEAGHEVRRLALAELDFPLLRTTDEFRRHRPPAAIARAQQDLAWAEHWVILYPLWLGAMPALLKAFLEQALRPGFAFGEITGRGFPPRLLAGRSARVVVTMGMPGLFYRLYYRAHSLKSFERNVLAFCGLKPIRDSLVGMVEHLDEADRRAWLERMRRFGARAT